MQLDAAGGLFGSSEPSNEPNLLQGEPDFECHAEIEAAAPVKHGRVPDSQARRRAQTIETIYLL
jgi:hypothetical protein